MAVEYVQEKINYRFADSNLLCSALKSAHRSDEERISDDGNRGLAKIGRCAMEMVETHNAVVVESKTEKHINSSDHWYKTKQGRASICKQLGISSHIVRSARQQQQEEPSTTVLSNALSAIFGAMWLDLENQDKSVADARKKVLEVLRGIESDIPNTSEGTLTNDRNISVSGRKDGYQPTIPTMPSNVVSPEKTYEHEIEYMDPFMVQWFGELSQDISENTAGPSVPLSKTVSELDSTPPNRIPTQIQGMTISNPILIENGNDSNSIVLSDIDDSLGHLKTPTNLENRQSSSTCQRSPIGTRNSAASVTPEKRKALHEDSRRHRFGSLHQKLLRTELQKLKRIPISRHTELKGFLEHAQIGQWSIDPSQMLQLRLMYMAIGSCQSLIDFKNQLHAARDMLSISDQPIGPTLSLTERFTEICRLDNKESFCVLSRRYHSVKLCETEEDLFFQNSQMIIDTPQTLSTVHNVPRGSPHVLQVATLTDRLLFRVRPDLKDDTVEFRSCRDKIKRLRKLAKILRVLTDTYGFGILALLPFGSTYSESPLTDTMLQRITERNFKVFSDLLYQQQGLFLKRLSRAVEPAVIALVTGSLVSRCSFPIENADAELLESLPKGSLEIFELIERPRV